MRLARLGKMPTTAVRRLISLLSRSSGLVEQVGLGIGQQLGDGREPWSDALDDTTRLFPGGALVGLFEDRADGRRDHAPGVSRDEVLGIARAVHTAALPGRPEELLTDSLHQTPVVVADDQPH